MADAFLSFAGVESGQRVLDVGCGTGIITLALAQRGCTAVGVDASEAYLAGARYRRSHPAIIYEHGDAQSLAHATASFDASVSLLAIDVIPEPEKAEAEMRRVTRPGGAVACGSVTGVIEPTLQAAETRRSAERPTSDLTAYDLYLRALSLTHTWEEGSTIAALDLLIRAVERDPHYGPALGLAAFCHYILHVNGWTNDPELNQCAGVDLCRQVLRVTSDDPRALRWTAQTLAYFGENIGAAIELIDRALALNPSFADAYVTSGTLRLWVGQPELAIDHFETSLRLSPHTRRACTPLIGMGHFFAQRFEEAAAMLLRSVQERPGWAPTYRFLAACYAHMGRLDEARETIERLKAVTPVVVPNAMHWRIPEHRELFLSGLRLATGETK